MHTGYWKLHVSIYPKHSSSEADDAQLQVPLLHWWQQQMIETTIEVPGVAIKIAVNIARAALR
jgi:hypothetical protein